MSVDYIMVERLTRVETKLDSVLQAKDTDRNDMSVRLQDHETRIRSLERVWWKTAGLAAGIGVVGGTGISAALRALFG